MAPMSVLIVGCGVAGPVLASFLLLTSQPDAQKPHITIVERSSSIRSQGQNIDIRGAGVEIIRKLGLEGLIRSSTTDEAGNRFVDEHNQIWGEYAADKTGQVQTGTSDIEILRGTLARLFYERSQTVSDEVKRNGGGGIEFIFGEYVERFDQDGDKVHVHLAKSGERRTFDVVVGADGLQSRTRRLIFGEEGEKERVKKLGMYAAFFSLPRGKNDSLWRRWFHAPGRRGLMVRPGETDDMSTVLMYVINEKDERLPNAAVDGRASVESQKALLAEYFHDAGWECPRFIREMNAADDFYYNMVAQIHMDRWSKGRVVLIGDAGYCASPISGMGTTLALTGAYHLAGALVEQPQDITSALAQYEENMRPIVNGAQKLAPGLLSFINPETAWGIWAMHWVVYLIASSGVAYYLSKFTGPGARQRVQIADYGFRSLPEVPAKSKHVNEIR